MSNSIPPLDALHQHYLKRELIRIQLAHELDVLSDFKEIGRLGYPFKPPHNATLDDGDDDKSMPILRHIFARHVRNFPFIVASLDKKGAPSTKEFWQDNVQTFLESLGQKELSSSEDREEATKRKRIGNKLTGMISIYMASGLQTENPDEKTAKIEGTATKLNTTSQGGAAAKSGVQNIDAAALATELSDAPQFINGIDINVVGVRQVKAKKRAGGIFMVSDDHAEFIIRARMAHPDYDHNANPQDEKNNDLMRDIPVTYVSRRFSDFQELDQKLSKELTGVVLPVLPTKNKQTTSLTGDLMSHSSNLPGFSGDSNSSNTQNDDFDDDDDDEEIFFDERSNHPTQHSLGSRKKSQATLRSNNNSNNNSNNGNPITNLFNNNNNGNAITNLFSGGSSSSNNSGNDSKRGSSEGIKLPREKQRLSFRAYLRSLLKIPAVAKSQTLLEFLFRDKMRRELTSEELEDIARRRLMDIRRVEEQVEFLRLATVRARALESHMTEFKSELMEPDGLNRLFHEIKTKESVDDLSPKFKMFLEWACVEFSASLYSMFIAEDSSADFFSQVSRIHRLMPYSVIKGILRWSNPIAIMKGIIDLFLAQPFGKKSLLQNIFYMVLSEDIKAQDRQINLLKKSLSPRYSEIIENVFNAYFDASPSVREEIKALNDKNNVFLGEGESHSELVVNIFRNSRKLVPDGGPLQDEISILVEAWYEAWNHHMDHPSDEHANEKYPEDYVACYNTTKDLLRQMMRRRDKDSLQALWNESSTMALIKEVFTIFYSPLVDVFKSAKVYEAVGDFENFMNDLIRIVKKAESSALTRGPNQMVDDLVALCHHHLGPLYRFVHEMYVNDKGLFFDGILDWLTGIVYFLRNGRVDERQVEKYEQRIAMNNRNSESGSKRHKFMSLTEKKEHEYDQYQANDDGDIFSDKHQIHNVNTRDSANFSNRNYKIDLDAVLANGVAEGLVEGNKVIDEVDQLIEWLKARRDWIMEQSKISLDDGNNTSRLNWKESMPISGSGGIDATTFGLVEDDLEAFDDMNKVAEADDLIDNEVDEKKRREMLLEKLKRQKQLPERPDIVEIEKLRKPFARALAQALFVG